MVIDAVKQHMRIVCGDVLDQLKGHNYEVATRIHCNNYSDDGINVGYYQ